jgi:hypothetical protein
MALEDSLRVYALTLIPSPELRLSEAVGAPIKFKPA